MHKRKGAVYSVEMLFVCVVLVIGIIPGLAALRAAVNTELADLGASILHLDTGYNVVSVGSTTGSANGTLVTHTVKPLNIGATNAVSTNTTVGTDTVGQAPPFDVPIVP
jgi:hypothetical protein